MSRTDMVIAPVRQGPASWRDTLPIHPAAELLPPMPPGELRQLGEDILRNKLTSPIAIIMKSVPREDGTIHADDPEQVTLVDGRSRLDALELVTGHPVQVILRPVSPRSQARVWFIVAGEWETWGKVDELDWDIDVYSYVRSVNVHRRHLTAKAKRKSIANLIKAAPEKSDRQIAETIKVSPTTVGTVRAAMEAKGDVSKLDTSTDTRGRKQPRNRVRAHNYRSAKLGEAVLAKTKGTSLDNARELDGLVRLNRGAPEGEITPIVKQLVDEAAGGKKVSAIAAVMGGGIETELNGMGEPAGGDQNRIATKPPPVSEEVLQERAAAAGRLRGLLGGNKVGTDSESASGNASDEQVQLRHFKGQNLALRSEIEELKAQVRDLEDRGLRAVPLAKLLDELEHRLPATLPKAHSRALKALRGELERRHLGATLDLSPVTDREATKH